MVENKIEKYYTPDISELHVDYECQIGNLFALPGSRWEWAETKPLKWSTIAFIAQAMIPERLVYIRTKYLDQSDIESCGWEYDGNDTDGWKKYYIFIGNISWYLYHGYNNEILITKYKEHNSKGTFYDGQCKSINELRKIMQWLNIK